VVEESRRAGELVGHAHEVSKAVIPARNHPDERLYLARLETLQISATTYQDILFFS
jgi:hypothetical protein